MTDAADQPTRTYDARTELVDLRGVVLQDRYELGEVLGSGGMGMVFEAKDVRLGRDVAVKVMRPSLALDGGFVKRFLREAQAASKIRHRNVVVLLDYGETTDGLVYSVMELLHGENLSTVLKSRVDRRMAWGDACDLLIQIASGLHAAHQQGVIHRDIKPANCLLCEEDDQPVIKLLDFGIAKLEDADQTQQLTGTGDVIGTPSYIAPELVRTHDRGSPQSDVYSLGVVAYRMLTGHAPFTGDTAFEVMRRACTERVPSMREQVPGLPRSVEDFVFSMLAKDPAERPADMQVVRQRLQVLRHEKPRPTEAANLGEAMFRKLSAELPRLQGNAFQLLSQHITPSASTRDKAAAIPKTVEKLVGAMAKSRDEGRTPMEEVNRAFRRGTRQAAKVLGEMQAVLQAGQSERVKTGKSAVVDADETLTSSPEEDGDELETTATDGAGKTPDSVASAADEETVAYAEGFRGELEEHARELDETVALPGPEPEDELELAPELTSAPEAEAEAEPEPEPEGPRRSSVRWLLLIAGLAAAGSLAFAMLGT